MIALGQAHRAAGLGLSQLDADGGKDLDEHSGRRPTAMVDGGARPIEEHRPDAPVVVHRVCQASPVPGHPSQFAQSSSASPNDIVMPAPPVPTRTCTPGFGSVRTIAFDGCLP